MIKNFLNYLLALIIISGISFLTFLLIAKYNLSTLVLDSFISGSVFILFLLGLKYQFLFVEFSTKHFLRFLLNHFIAALFISTMWISIAHFLAKQIIFNKEEYLYYYEKTILWRFILGVLLYFLITAFNYLFKYYESYKKQILLEAELKNLITEAELKSLKFQINPHFIFNCLNSIASLTSINSNKAREMTINLAEFLRYTLSRNLKQTEKFIDEIEIAKKYVAIEKIRFDDKFIFVEEIENDTLDVKVPNMILQPLIENAIKYGVYESLSQVKIYLNAKMQNGLLNISIENDFDKDTKNIKGEGVGLANIVERLKLIYNRIDLLKIEKSDSKFKVNITIPAV